MLQPLNDAAQQLRQAGDSPAIVSKVNDAHQRIVEMLQINPLATLKLDEQGKIAAQPAERLLTVYRGVPDAIILRIGPSSKPSELTLALSTIDGLQAQPQKLAIRRSFETYAALPITATAPPGNYRAELKITSAVGGATLPLTIQVNPSGTLSGRLVRAGDGSALSAKLFVEDETGRLYVMPGENSYHTQSWYAFFKPRFSYVSDTFELPLPPGRYRLTAMKGPAYIPAEQSIQIAPDQTTQQILSLRRVVETEETGWFSADMHAHGSVTLPMMRAEDVNVVGNTIYSSNRKMPLTLDQKSSDTLHLLVGDQEIEHWLFGNGFWFNMPTTVQDPKGTGPEKTPMFFYDKQAHEMGGVTMRYMRTRPYSDAPRGGGQDQIELAADVALGHLDVWSIMDNSVQELCATARPQWGPEAWDATSFARQTYATWYRLLNCGLRPTASAGTSYGRLSKLGFNRIYVHCPDPLSVGSFAAALKRGDGFVTNGPLLWLKVDGKLPGDGLSLTAPADVTVTVELVSAAPIKMIQLISGGKIVATKTIDEWPSTGRLIWEQALRVDRPTWFAARCFGQDTPRYPHTLPNSLFAHTNPLMVTVGNAKPSSPADAAEFVKEIDFLLKMSEQIPDETLQKQSQDEFRKAREIYAKMAGAAN